MLDDVETNSEPSAMHCVMPKSIDRISGEEDGGTHGGAAPLYDPHRRSIAKSSFFASIAEMSQIYKEALLKKRPNTVSLHYRPTTTPTPANNFPTFLQ